MATYNTQPKTIALIVMAVCLIALGYMDEKEAELMERASVQVAVNGK